MKTQRFKQRVLDALAEKGWNQSDLEQAMGKHRGYVSQRFRGDEVYPKTIHRFAQALGKPTAYFTDFDPTYQVGSKGSHFSNGNGGGAA